MEDCLGGSRRFTKAQKDLHQLKKRLQQQPPNQNYYTTHQHQQKPLVDRTKPKLEERHTLPLELNIQLQQHQHQEHQGLVVGVHQSSSEPSMSSTNPNFVENCMNFPPPPDYPPPHQVPAASEIGNVVATSNVKSVSTIDTKPRSHHYYPHQTIHHHQQHPNQYHTKKCNEHIEHAVVSMKTVIDPKASSQHVHYSSASSPSSPSTSGTTINVTECGRRTMTPRYSDLDLDAIEVYGIDDSVQSSVMKRIVEVPKTLGHPQGNGKWTSIHQTTSMKHNTHHDYSYAYYEPGAAMRHSNIPPPEQVSISRSLEASVISPPPPNSIRALLSKGKKNKLLVSSATRQSYKTRYGVGTPVSSSSTNEVSARTQNSRCGTGAGENFYEEISSSDTRHQLPLTATTQSGGSLNQSLVEEELRRVQNRHRKILGELNLSVEAMLMPESSPASSPTKRSSTNVSVTATSGQPVISDVVGLRLSSNSADNICNSANTIGSTDELIFPLQTSTLNAGFCGDLDSGFSGSSGASYIGSLRIHKTNVALSQLISSKQHSIASATSSSTKSDSGAFTYAVHNCRSFHRATGKQSRTNTVMHIDDSTTSGFLTRASCGRRILNCAKIRAAEDPGPVLATESKARSFWNRKGWHKLPGFASTSSMYDTGLTDEQKVNSGSWEETALTGSPESGSEKVFSGITTTTTAQLHSAAPALRHSESLSGNTARSQYNGLHPLLIPAVQSGPTGHQHQQLQIHHHQHSKNCGSPTSSAGTQIAEADHTTAISVPTDSTIAGESFNTNGGSASTVGGSITSANIESSVTKNRLDHSDTKKIDSSRALQSEDSWCSDHDITIGKGPTPPLATTSDEEAVTEDEQSSSVTSSLSAPNQRNSQLRSTFNKAKQHLSFDKWRSSLSANSGIPDSNGPSSHQGRRASTCTMPTAHQPPREDITTPGESPGGRLSRWFSIRRGSSHQYDVGGRDGRQSSSSNMDIPDSVSLSCHEHHLSPQKLSNSNSSHTNKMPGVPENENDDLASLGAATSRFDLDMMIPPGSRANGTARNANTRLIMPTLPPAPPGLSQQQLKRRHIVAAIVHSENSYVATLQRLVNDYKTPLEASSPPVLSATKIATLFHRLPEILQSHKLFRIALSECVRNWDRDEKLGDCFVSAFSKPRILEIYSGFINNFSAAMELAKMEEKRKSALADFFKVKQISAHDRLSFFGLMVKPVQRFPQFILFLQDLLKYTPQGHHDRMSLQLALTQLELLAEMLNERKREAEQYQGFKEMLGHISGTFNTRSLTSTDGHRPRYLLREDNVTHLEFNQAGFIVKSKQRRLLLLNDKVICVSVAPKQSHDFGATEKLSFKWMYPVTDVEIVVNSTSATLSRILTAGLNRGGSLKSNCSSGTNNMNHSLNAPFALGSTDQSSAAQLTSGADNLCSEMSTLMYDYEVISRIHDLVGTLKGTYKELNSNTTRNLLNTIQSSIQRKDEEMAWADSCCLQLIARSKSGKEETFTFQTQNPNVKKEWITELRLAQLALDTNNSPAWEASLSEPIHTYEQQQQHQLQQQKQSSKMPLFVKAMPVFKSQHQTEVRCGCYYSIANDAKLTGNARRRHKQQSYLWICASDGTSSHIAIYSQHHQQAGNLRDVSAFDLVELQVTAMEFVKGLDNCKTRDEYNNLLGDLLWMGTDSRKIFIYSAQNPEQEQQLSCCLVPATVMRILYHFDAVYVALSNATMLIFRRSYDGVWMLKDPQVVQLGTSGMSVPSLLPINMNIYAACANRVYVLNAFNGEIQKSFEVHHGANQQVNLMAHSGIGLWISLKNSTVLCLYHTETFKHLQDINVASSVLRNDGKKEQTVNNSSIYVTALMACKGLLWVGTNVGIAVTIPLPRLEGVPIISGGVSMSCHAHFGPITFLLPLVPKVYSSYKPPTAQTLASAPVALEPSPPPSMGEDLQLPAIDDDPKNIAEADLDETSGVILRRDLRRDDLGSGTASPSACMLRDLSVDADSATSSPRCSKLDKQISLDQTLSAKIRASLANSPAFHRKRFRDLSLESARMSKTLPRGSGSVAHYFNNGLQSNTNTLNHYEHGYCDVYGLYGKLIFVKEDYDAEEGTQGNLMDTMYEGMRRSDPELAAIPGKVSTLDRRLRMKASRPRSLDLSNWSVDSKSSSLYTSSGSEESMGIRMFGVRSVSRNSSSASHKTSGAGSDLGNISENGLMTIADIHQHSTPKSEDGFKMLFADKHPKLNSTAAAGSGSTTDAAPAAAAVATLKRKQKQTAKQQQLNGGDGPRTIITLMGGRGYWRHMWYNTSNSPGCGKSTQMNSSSSSGSSSPLIANSNDAHIVVWEKKL